MSIRTKLLLLLFACIFGGLAAVTAVVAWQTTSNSRKDYVLASQEQMQRLSESVQLFFELTGNTAAYMAAMPETLQARSHLPLYAYSREAKEVPREGMAPQAAELDRRLEMIVRANPAYGDVGVGMEDGGFLEFPTATWPGGFDPRKRPWYIGAMEAAGETAVSPVYVTPQGHPVCAVAAKIRDATGAVIGATYIDIRLTTLVGLVESVKLGETGGVTLIENTGTIIASHQFRDRLFTNVAEGAIPGLEQVLTLEDGAHELTVDGVARVVTTLTGFGGWRLVAVVDEAELRAASARVIQEVMAVAVILALLLGCLGYLFARNLTRPIGQLLEGAEKLAAGDFSRIPDIRRQDEFGKLGQAFSAMARQLKERLGFAQGIMNGLTTPFAVADVEGRLTFINQRFMDYWGVPGQAEDHYGTNSGQTLHRDPTVKTPLDTVLEDLRPTADVPLSAYNLRGEKRSMQVSAAPLLDLDGRVLGSFMVIADVTEMREQQDRIVALGDRITTAVSEAQDISRRQAETFARLTVQLDKTADAARQQEEESGGIRESISEMSRTLEELSDMARQTTEDSRATRRKPRPGAAWWTTPWNASTGWPLSPKKPNPACAG